MGTRRLRRGWWGLQRYGFSPALVPEGFQRASGKPFGAPAGAYPLPRIGNDAPTTAQIGICRPMGFPPASVSEACQRASGKPFGAPAGAYPCPGWGLTRRLRRGQWGCRPEGAVLSFEAKESTKESTRHGDSGKKALIAHFAGGARYVARSMIGRISPAIRRAPNSPFSAVKMGGPFSLRCLSPLCFAAAWVGAEVG